MFLWKACNDILPTKLKLFKIGIVPHSKCSICPSARDVWTGCTKKFHKCSFIPVTFIHILETLMQRLKDEEIQLFVVVAR